MDISPMRITGKEDRAIQTYLMESFSIDSKLIESKIQSCLDQKWFQGTVLILQKIQIVKYFCK